MKKDKRPVTRDQCRPYVCTFELPASCEAAYRSGDKTLLRDHLVEHMKQLGRQVAQDYEARIAEMAKPNEVVRALLFPSDVQ